MIHLNSLIIVFVRIHHSSMEPVLWVMGMLFKIISLNLCLNYLVQLPKISNRYMSFVKISLRYGAFVHLITKYVGTYMMHDA